MSEDNRNWFTQYITPYVAPIIVSFIIGSSSAYGMIKLNTYTQYQNKETIQQEVKRNNIQDVNISRLQEKTSNWELILHRIEDNQLMLTVDLKEFMKNVPKEIRRLTKEISETNKIVAVLKDREERNIGGN